jgi:hypothetical protein
MGDSHGYKIFPVWGAPYFPQIIGIEMYDFFPLRATCKLNDLLTSAFHSPIHVSWVQIQRIFNLIYFH